ncbi:MAG: alpha/beta hydrolase [Proteobacteria bacterium]|nr:alpha/beta hydrolase [Pseudomonadota bacterium]
MPFVNVSGENIHYLLSGDQGPGLVLIHGSGSSHAAWPVEILTLPGVRVAALDLPGHGKSEGAARKSVDEYARVVAGAIEAMGLARAYVCGHSLGGAVALSLALAKPAWLAGIILVGSGARLRVNPLILEAITQNFEQALDLMDPFLFAPGADPELVKGARLVAEAAGPEVLLTDFSACDRFDVMARVGEIQIPCLVVTADKDQLTPAKYGRYLAAGIPGAQLVEIAGAGHVMMMEKPVEVARALAGFIR